MPPESSFFRRDGLDPLCPADNGTTYTANGYSWDILCGYDYPGNDLPAQPATDLVKCIDACNNYQRDINEQNGASCVAVSYNSANVNGNPCYLKSSVNQVTSNQNRIYVARRVQYNVGDSPIYSSITPSAGAASTQPAQASTSISVLASSVTQASSARLESSAQYSTLISIKTVLTGVLTVTSSIPVSGSPTALQTSNSAQTDTNAASASATSPSSSSPSSSSTQQSSGGLSDGAKIGVGVGVGVAGAIILGLLLYIFCSRRKRRKHEQSGRALNGTSSNSNPVELDQSSKPISQHPLGDKPVLLANHPHPSAQEKNHPIQELSSPVPVAELDSPKYELSGHSEERAAGDIAGQVHQDRSLVSPASPGSRASGSATLGSSPSLGTPTTAKMNTSRSEV